MTEVHPEEHIRNEVPGSLSGRYDDQYRLLEAVLPPASVTELPNGRVAGDGVVIGPDGRLIVQMSRAIGSLRSFVIGLDQETDGHFKLERHLAAPPRQLHGTTVLMAAFAGRGYFHWVFDVLPRLGLVADAGFDLTQVDHFVVNNLSAGYQIETLEKLGVDRRRVVTTFSHPHLVADRLIVPSLPREGGGTPSWVCQFLRSAFPRRGYSAAVPNSRRIYVSRAATDHLRLPNERRLLERLRSLGFFPVLLERLSMEEKATLFGRAEVVIGPSGAGLTNLVFSEPGTVAIEACTRGYATLDPWDIANRVGARYFYVPGSEGGGSGEYGVTVPEEELMGTLELAGVS